jgi:Xaa-Pro aminopeptidase
VSPRAAGMIERLSEAGVEAILITDLVNVRYLTGYTGSNGIALVAPQTRTFITDFRYVTQAETEVDPSFERRRASQDLLDALEESLPADGLRLGFEEAHMTVREYARLRELLPDRVELVGVSGVVEDLRAVKSTDEIDRIRAAAALADDAFEDILAGGLVGRTEREITIALEYEMRQRGAERPSFETIVAAGPHGALPHASPRDIPIPQGVLVVIDWGAQLDGYCSDCTRTVATGEVGAEARDVYQLVLDAQLAGVQAVRAGAGCREVDSIARAVIDGGGHGEQFGHGLGHGVGLDVHEGPRLSQRSDETLAAGNVVTVEPGVYVPGAFGVRVEDLVAVTDGGCEILSSVGKDLLVVE